MKNDPQKQDTYLSIIEEIEAQSAQEKKVQD